MAELDIPIFGAFPHYEEIKYTLYFKGDLTKSGVEVLGYHVLPEKQQLIGAFMRYWQDVKIGERPVKVTIDSRRTLPNI